MIKNKSLGYQFKYLVFACCFGLACFQTLSEELQSSIQKLVNQVGTEFEVPGIAVGIVKQNKVIHLKGYGVADILTKKAVDEDTLYKIASNTKAFTSAALAILVEQGKLNWDDKVIKYLPNFKMYDPWVTQEFNIRDLLTHRSGLRIGAGDLMLWPEPTKFTRTEVIENLRYLKPVASFRDEYAYDNLLYIVAGEVVAKISGISWEAFIQSNIFKPLEMSSCFAGGVPKVNAHNIASPHATVEGNLVVLDKYKIVEQTSLMAAAGGIKCSLNDLTKWVQFQLKQGQLEDGKRLFSSQIASELWKPVTTLPISDSMRQLDKTSYRAYALGWRISDYHGVRRVSHTGTLSGFMSQIILFPEQEIGIVLLTNQQSGEARDVLAKGLSQLLLHDIPYTDWVEVYKNKIVQKTKVKKNKRNEATQELKIANNKQSTQRFGRFEDAWFGFVRIEKDKNSIRFNSEKSPRMTGEIFQNKSGRWWVKWDDRSFEADAWLDFESTINDGKTLLTMKPILSTTDFSFNFEDLYFTKVENN